MLLVSKIHYYCKIPSLLVAEVTIHKKSLITRKMNSLLVTENARSKKSFVTRSKICSLLVAEVAHWKKSLITRSESCFSLQKFTPYSLQKILIAKITVLVVKFVRYSL